MPNKLPLSLLRDLRRTIRSFREKRGISQAEAATEAGMPPNYFAQIERGEINMSLGTLYKIVKGLGIKAKDIIPF